MDNHSNKVSRLTEKTLIPLSLAIMVIGGGAAWLTDVHAEVSHQGQQISEMGEKRDETSRVLTDILVQLSEIKTELRLLRSRQR